jgi:hypothetical protein
MSDRPGELVGRQPVGERLGFQGPDQGYALTLADTLRGTLPLNGESEDDVVAGVAAVGMKRASLFGRAPVMHDLTAAMAVFGFLDEKPPKELLELRRRALEEVHSPHHYEKLRELVEMVPAEVLYQPHQAIVDQARDNWKSVLALD